MLVQPISRIPLLSLKTLCPAKEILGRGSPRALIYTSKRHEHERIAAIMSKPANFELHIVVISTI
jgi:hypothetical protein